MYFQIRLVLGEDSLVFTSISLRYNKKQDFDIQFKTSRTSLTPFNIKITVAGFNYPRMNASLWGKLGI